MPSVLTILTERFRAAFARALPSEHHGADPLIRATDDAQFGDYQSNAAMGLAKALKKNPRQLAQDIVAALDLGDVCSEVSLAGPGFINLRLSPGFLAASLTAVREDVRLGIPKSQSPQHVVIDFSSPNLAKEMHVGHLRTTITGEAIARIVEFQGHTLERVNHVGDWGTQFGMLLEYLRETQPDAAQKSGGFVLKDLEEFYKAAKTRFDADADFADRARRQVVALQSGEADARKIWQAFLNESLRHCHDIYKILGVTLTDLGESFYNDRLPGIVQELLDRKIAVSDQGAVCVFLDGFSGRDNEPLPMIIRKSDGGYNYDTTDLAALKYRVHERKARRLIYVTDIRQAQHFAMLFAAARKAGWVDDSIRLDHVGYGMVLGQDRKPFKTRDGGTVRLRQLLDEAIERARSVVTANQAHAADKMDAAQAEAVAQAVGLAAIKYFDLSHSLGSDYVFSWEQMLAMEGNTGPYMLYAYARIKSIGRKAGRDLDKLPASPLLLEHPSELGLAKTLLQFPDALASVSDTLRPNVLTDYLYGLSKVFNAFYDKKSGVKVIDTDHPERMESRLLLCALTARTLKVGLNLLSIEVVEQM